MKKLLLMVIFAVALAGCNRQIIDFKYKFETAIIRWPDGTVKEVKIKKWRDYRDGDAVQIIDEHDTVYLTHYNNVILIHKENK